jgi:hypothetical protein
MIVQVYEKVLPDAFAALLDLCPDGEQPMVYFLCLAKTSEKVSSFGFSKSSQTLMPAHHVILDTSVPWKVTRMSLVSMDTTTAQAPQVLQQQPLQPPVQLKQQRLSAKLRLSHERMRQPHMASCQQLQKQLSEVYVEDTRRSAESSRSDADIEFWKNAESSDVQLDSFDERLLLCEAIKAGGSMPEIPEIDLFAGCDAFKYDTFAPDPFLDDIFVPNKPMGALLSDTVEFSNRTKKRMHWNAEDELMSWL